MQTAERHLGDTMHERKALMVSQLGLHAKPEGLLNVDCYFDPLLNLIRHAVTSGFVSPAGAALLDCDFDIERLLDRLTAAIR